MFRDTVGREDLREALRQVPVEWLEALLGGAGAGVERRREAYVAFLWKRLRSPPPAFDG